MNDDFLNEVGVRYLWGRIKSIFVRKEDGKGLSEENFTTELKEDLEGLIQNGGSAAPIQKIKVNGDVQNPDEEKTVDIQVPTTTNDLYNNSDFQTSTDVEAAIQEALQDLTGIDFQEVPSYDQLPPEGKKGVIYLIPSDQESDDNRFDEYVWISSKNKYERIGTAKIDLSNYWSKDDLEAITTERIDEITEN